MSFHATSDSLLLLTKLARPQVRRPVVQRSRLLEALERGRSRAVSLVSGPAGSGKSTLLSDWLSQLPVPTAWLSLDSLDNEPRRLLAYLTQALRALVAELPADAAGQLLASTELDAQAVLRSFVLPTLHAFAPPSVLVLDDVHVLSDPAALALLRMLIHDKPSQLHVVISSRSEPDLGLVILRARAQLSELRATELRFLPREAFEFYNTVMNLQLDEARVVAIEAHTEGWIAACQLAGLRLKENAQLSLNPVLLAGEGTWITDYLLEEVFRHLAPAVQDLLLGISVLPRLCDALCAELLAPATAPMTLRQLAHANLFVLSVDEAGRWYRFHSVMAGFLRERLQRLTPQRIPELHRRASAWFYANQLYEEAIDHAIWTRDELFVCELMERSHSQMLARGELTAVRRGLGALGPQRLYERPKLALADAWCAAYLDDDPAKLRFCLERVQAALTAHGPPLGEHERSGIHARLGVLRAILELRLGNLDAARQIADRALKELPAARVQPRALLEQVVATAAFARGDFEPAQRAFERAEQLGKSAKSYVIVLSAMAGAAAIHHLRIELKCTRELCERALQLAREQGHGLLPVVGTLHVELGLCHFYQGRYDEALLQLERGVERHSLTKYHRDVATASCFLARLRLRIGDAAGAAQAMNESVTAARHSGSQDVVQFVLSYQALLDLQQGHLDKALRWARTSPEHGVVGAVYREHIRLVVATIELFAGHAPRVVDELRALAQRQRACGFALYALIADVVRAVALERLGRVEQAAEALTGAARLAFVEDIRVYFQVWGPEAEWRQSVRRLVPVVKDAELQRYVAQLVGAEPHQRSASQPAAAQPEAALLTSRELEVLAHIASGMSNSEIAKTLFVSLPTVKTHIQHIFRKLDVKNRTAALRAAQRRNLMPTSDAR